MPYISPERRRQLMDATVSPRSSGELNYLITCLITEYLEKYGLDYTNLNACVGALSCAQLELYERVIKPYERKKRQENGDVYPDNLTR